MKALASEPTFPAGPLYPFVGFSHGINIDWPRPQQPTWIWNATQERMDRFVFLPSSAARISAYDHLRLAHFKVRIVDVFLRLIHQRS